MSQCLLGCYQPWLISKVLTKLIPNSFCSLISFFGGVAHSVEGQVLEVLTLSFFTDVTKHSLFFFSSQVKSLYAGGFSLTSLETLPIADMQYQSNNLLALFSSFKHPFTNLKWKIYLLSVTFEYTGFVHWSKWHSLTMIWRLCIWKYIHTYTYYTHTYTCTHT